MSEGHFFHCRSGNVALVTFKESRTTKAVVVDVEWSKPPSRKDIKEFNLFVKRQCPDNEMESALIDNDAERARVTAHVLTHGAMPDDIEKHRL